MELYKTTDLEIVDKNIDQIINSIENTKKELYPDSIIKPPIVATETQTKEKTLEDVKEIVNITLEFVSNKKRKIYGGYAQNKAVIHKNKDDAFYKDTDVPDIDVYSPRPIEDLVELCNILNEKGYTDVIGREAIHKETYKIFTNGYNAIDLSYVPKNVFDAIPFIEINKIRYVNPSFSMIDLYRMLSEPLFSSWRWKKAINRLYLLQKYYPFENIKNAKVNDAYKHKKDVSKATNIIIDFIKDNESVYIVGDFAYNQLVKESKCKDFSEIAVGIYQIVSTDYKTDVKKLLDKFKTSNVNVKIF